MLGPEVSFVGRDNILVQNTQFLYFGGTDYHRFSHNPEIINEVSKAVEKYGIGSSGSRVTTGNHFLYRELEDNLAGFFQTESALILSSGYLSNTVLMEGIGDLADRFFVDDTAHKSLIMAVKLTEKPVHYFQHINSESLVKCIQKNIRPREIPFVVTDGVFSSRGEIPPLGEYETIISEYGGKILLDDSHAMAVLGTTGKGSWEYAKVSRKNIYQTGTLSKGFGVFGGVIVGTLSTINTVKEKSGVLCGSTCIPLPLASAIQKSLSILRADPRLIKDLQRKSLSLKRRLRDFGFDLPISPSPIISITHYDDAKNNQLKENLIRSGIYVPYIHYPGSPKGGHFRLAISSRHTDSQIEKLFDVITVGI